MTEYLEYAVARARMAERLAQSARRRRCSPVRRPRGRFAYLVAAAVLRLDPRRHIKALDGQPNTPAEGG
jgi:hypothetical protein